MGITLATVGRFSLYKRKLSELWLVHNPCSSLYKQLEILPFPWQCIHSLMNCIINNQEIFQINSSIHNINTRNKRQLSSPNANLHCFQKSTSNPAIKIFYSLPSSVKILKNDKAQFKAALTKYLPTHSHYSVDKIFVCNIDLYYFCKFFVVFHTINLYMCIYDCSISL